MPEKYLSLDIPAVDTAITAMHVVEGTLRPAPLVVQEGLVVKPHLLKRHLVAAQTATLVAQGLPTVAALTVGRMG